jgi:heat shock protein 5
VYVNGRVEIIANDQGNRITPSVVAFSEGDRLIGESAKNQAALNPTNTVYDAKRLIGRKYVAITQFLFIAGKSCSAAHWHLS